MRGFAVLPGGAGSSAPARPELLLCGHCAHRPARLPATRVCEACELGLVLAVGADLAPTPADPFLLVDSSLQVSGVSRRAERLLRGAESDLVARHLSEVLQPADVEGTNHELCHAVAFAAREGGPPRDLVVRPTGEFGIRWWARVGPCGPPRGALVVLASA